MFLIDVFFFGPIGITIWAIQMIWIPLFAAGIVNGLGHYFGYRNFESPDASKNMIPWGVLIGGEELHNNHHSYATSAKLSMRKGEFDIGWIYIRLLSAIGQAKVRKLVGNVRWKELPALNDQERLMEIIAHRYDILHRFGKAIREVVGCELNKAKESIPLLGKVSMKQVCGWLLRDSLTLKSEERTILESLLDFSPLLAKLYALRKSLTELWESTSVSQDQLIQRLQSWLDTAKRSGVPELNCLSRAISG